VDKVDSPTGRENPFSTRHVRPGALPFLFPEGENADGLVERLRQAGWQGEIVGGHGSGKSALLVTLMPALERAGRHPLLVELHDGQRRLPIDLHHDKRLQSNSVLIVDGYEQLNLWNRWRLKRRSRRQGWGLVITAHSTMGFPTLYRTAATLDLTKRIVAELMAGRQPPCSDDALADCLARHQGDMRETLFELYDLLERGRPH
jgi:hypothetical protein